MSALVPLSRPGQRFTAASGQGAPVGRARPAGDGVGPVGAVEGHGRSAPYGGHPRCRGQTEPAQRSGALAGGKNAVTVVQVKLTPGRVNRGALAGVRVSSHGPPWPSIEKGHEAGSMGQETPSPWPPRRRQGSPHDGSARILARRLIPPRWFPAPRAGSTTRTRALDGRFDSPSPGVCALLSANAGAIVEGGERKECQHRRGPGRGHPRFR